MNHGSYCIQKLEIMYWNQYATYLHVGTCYHSVDVPILDEPLREFVKKGFDNAVFDTMEEDRYFSCHIPFRWEQKFTLLLAQERILWMS